jgi:hypothetical protein
LLVVRYRLEYPAKEGHVPTRKREITIRFVTAARGAKISSIIDTLSDQANDISITCKTLGREPIRQTVQPASNNGRSAIAPSNEADHPKPDEEEHEPHRPQLVYRADGSAAHRRQIDVEASLAKLGLKRDDLVARRWPRGSPQHRLKRAVVAANRMN